MKDSFQIPCALLNASTRTCLKAVRSIFQEENKVDLLIEKQMHEFSKLRKLHPQVQRKVMIKISMLNAALYLVQDKYDIDMCVAKVSSKRSRKQYEWLLEHRSFVMDLHIKGLSLRKIELAILYRFRHKISHTLISKFLTNEAAK